MHSLVIITPVSLAWGWHALVVGAPVGAAPLWILRQQGLYLSGLLSIAVISDDFSGASGSKCEIDAA